MSHIVTELFTTYGDAKNAVMSLQNAGIESKHISLISNDPDEVRKLEEMDLTATAGTGAGIGAAVGGAGGLLAGLGLMAIPGLGPVVAAGWLASTITGLAAGAAAGAATGGIVSALSGEGLTEEEANFYADRVNKGDTLVCVKTDDANHDAVQTILVRQKNVGTQSTYATAINPTRRM